MWNISMQIQDIIKHNDKSDEKAREIDKKHGILQSMNKSAKLRDQMP